MKRICAQEFALEVQGRKTSAGLGFGESGSEVVLGMSDQNDKCRVLLGLNKAGESGLWLGDQNGRIRTGLSSTEAGQGLVLRDQNGEARIVLKVTEAGTPKLVLHDQNGKTRAELSMDESGAAGLTLFDPDGKVVWQAP
jgi:hypothetical protein